MSEKVKYCYNKDLQKFARLNPPVVLPLLPLMQLGMKNLYSFQFSDKKLRVEKIRISLESGVKLRCLVYTPVNAETKSSPCIVFYHGGGFVYNAAPHHFTLVRNLAERLSAKVFFVDYRLAPAFPFPAAVNDAFECYRYISANAESFGIDKNRIALCGDSAGGNLAAVTSLRARDSKITPPCAQVLLYPFVDSDSGSESMKRFTDTPMCNSKAALQYNKAYIPGGKGEPVEWFSVVDAKDHSNLPETYIETAEFDCLYDGGVKLAEKLLKSGVRAELFETKGTMHGYDIATKSETYRVCMEKRCAFLKEIFER